MFRGIPGINATNIVLQVPRKTGMSYRIQLAHINKHAAVSCFFA